MASNRLMMLSVLGWVPCALALPNLHLARATTAAPVVSFAPSMVHTPYTGTPTVTGALNASSTLAANISSLGVAPSATTYPSDGRLQDPVPAPFVPAGGVGTNGTTPVYNAKSDFDFQSLALVLYAEYIELDLFFAGLAQFSEADFGAAGLTPEDRYLVQFMAEQEIGHATLVTNILGAAAPKQCQYSYPFTSVREFVDFCQKLTRFTEAGVYGFLAHLDSREAATLLTQTITTEARQQMIFRQFEGLFPMPIWFEVGVPQSWAWTLLAPYISSCPAQQTRLAWQNFPALRILNQPNPNLLDGSRAYNQTLTSGMNTSNGTAASNSTSSGGRSTSSGGSSASGAYSCINSTTIGENCSPAITRNRTIPLSYPGRQVALRWESPGKAVGPNNSYVTSTSAGSPQFVVWVSQLNVTYTPLRMSGMNSSTGTTMQPDMQTFDGDPAVNGTMFIAITDSDPFLTPFNISMINPHVVAGPALYQAG